MSTSSEGTTEASGRNVRQKAGLNQAILDQGQGQFRIMLCYKLAKVPAAGTSPSRVRCSVVDVASWLDQSRFECVACGHTANTDTNAAINILWRADGALKPVEGPTSKQEASGGLLNAPAWNLGLSGPKADQSSDFE